MRISNIIPGLLAVAIPCHGPILLADDISLSAGGSRLTGSVRSIDEAGVLELSSPLSPEPLRLRDGMVRKVEFSPAAQTPEASPAMVTLANGDQIPAAIEALDEKELTLNSPAAGRLVVPRAALSSLQLGVGGQKLVYQGPKNLAEWSGPDGPPKNLTFEEGKLVASGPISASREFALPPAFILRFTLAWQPKYIPNFQLFFADPLKPKGEPADRYYLQFNGAGFEVKRESTKGKRYLPLSQLNRTPNQFPDRELRVELRVNRPASRVQLFLNGEPEGEFVDPSETVPEGGGLALVCNSSNGNVQEIRNIEILELDDSRGRHRAEDRGDPKNDSLISREDDRWSGRLLGIRRADGVPVFRFKSDFQDEPVEVPEADVSTVFFAKPEAAAEEARDDLHLLRIRGGGSLRVRSCRFDQASVSASHPLLGAITLARASVSALERRPAENPDKPKP